MMAALQSIDWKCDQAQGAPMRKGVLEPRRKAQGAAARNRSRRSRFRRSRRIPQSLSQADSPLAHISGFSSLLCRTRGAPRVSEPGESSRQDLVPNATMGDAVVPQVPPVPAVSEGTDIASQIARAVIVALMEFQRGLVAGFPAPVQVPIPAPAPAPVLVEMTLERYLRNFRELQPSNYSGDEIPMDTDDWIANTRDLLNVLECPENKKVPLAVFLLRGEAKVWWDKYRADDPAGKVL
ncbi:hypothetical protein KSP39_PZI017096 [Platanthera zijinensis]|uniref:Uncharacterized protein n=1 Tax=Platanthera zijinensis TaxID=2320716 RepID=A0AAP0FZV8_9ASPA